MTTRARLISGVALAAVAFAAWRFMSPPAQLPVVKARQPAPEPVAVPTPIPPGQQPPPTQDSSAEPQTAEPVADPNALNERTLVGTKWEREGFGIEFGADGKLIIGGRERAQWRVEGQRIRLYRDTTGEEHWLDIVGHKLMWEGQEIGRVP